MKKHTRTWNLYWQYDNGGGCQGPLTNPGQKHGKLVADSDLPGWDHGSFQQSHANRDWAHPTEKDTAHWYARDYPGLLPGDLQIKNSLGQSPDLWDVAGYASYCPHRSRAWQRSLQLHLCCDAIGTLWRKMESGTKWDLIVVASEFKNTSRGITGRPFSNMWTTILPHDRGEHLPGQYRPYEMKTLLKECGIDYQSKWSRGAGFLTVDYAMFWVVEGSPVFNTPNVVDRFRYSSNDAKLGNCRRFC